MNWHLTTFLVTTWWPVWALRLVRSPHWLHKATSLYRKHPLPRHQHVVKEYDGVHLLETAAGGMVEVRPAQVNGVPALELQTPRCRRVWRTRRRTCLPRPPAPGACGPDRRAISSDKGPRVASTLAPRNDDAGVGFLDHRQCDLSTVVERRLTDGTAALEVDQRVGHHDVVFRGYTRSSRGCSA